MLFLNIEVMHKYVSHNIGDVMVSILALWDRVLEG